MIAWWRKCKSLARLTLDSVNARGNYATNGSALKALVLRLASSTSGQVVKWKGTWSLRLRGVDGPVYVRPGTSDFLLVRDIFEASEYRFVEAWNLPSRPRIVDLGANIGLASLYFGSTFPGARLCAVEPDSQNFTLLQMNCAHLLASNAITLTEGFAAGADGAATLDRTGDNWAFRKVALADQPDVEKIACYSVASLLSKCAFEGVDLLKCDIEGSEAELFAQCASWIGKVDRLIVETHLPYSPDSLRNDLIANGWQHDVCKVEPAGPHSVCFLQKSGL